VRESSVLNHWCLYRVKGRFTYQSLPLAQSTITTMDSELARPAATSLPPPPPAPEAVSTVDAVNPPVGDNPGGAATTSYAVPRAIESLESFLSRPQLITSMSFPLTPAAAIASIKPLSAFLTNTVISNKLQYLKNIRATVCVRLEMPVTPHYYGEAFAALVPTFLSACNTTLYQARLYQMRPGGIFNANTGNPLVLRLPHFGRYAKWPTNNTGFTDTFCTLYLGGLSALGRDDGVAVGTPLFNVYVWLEDVELMDATPYTTYAGTHPTAHALPATKKETSPGVISSVASAVSSVARKMVPILPIGGVVADVADFVGGVASFFGYSRPNQPNQFEFVRSRYPYFSQGVGRDSSAVLALDPAAAREINPGIGGYSDEDPLAFEFFTRQWGFLGSVTYATTTAPDTLLASVPVTPFLADNTTFVLTPCAMPCLATERWVGSIEFRITVAATPFHRGKLLVGYIPSVSTVTQPTIATMMNTTHCCIVDVTQSTDIVVRCGFSNEFYTKTCYATSGSLDGTHFGNPTQGGIYGVLSASMQTTTSLIGTNGQLVIIAFDSLSATAAGSLSINVWARGGPDLQFGGAASTTGVTYVTLGGPAAPATDFEQQVGQIDDQPSVCHMGGALVQPGVMRRLWGEEILSFRTILKRSQPLYTMSPSTTALTAANYQTVLWPLPGGPLVTKSVVSSPWGAVSTNTGWVVPAPSVLSLLSSCFHGWAGGMNFKILPHPIVPTTAQWLVTAADATDEQSTTGNYLVSVASQTCASAATATSAAATLMKFAQGAEINSGTNPVEYATLYNSQSAYSRTTAMTNATTAPIGANVSYRVSNSTVIPVIDVVGSVGEDFNFYFFMGCPAVGASTQTLKSGFTDAT